MVSRIGIHELSKIEGELGKEESKVTKEMEMPKSFEVTREGKREQKDQLGMPKKYRSLENSVAKGNSHRFLLESLKATRRTNEKNGGLADRDRGKNGIRWRKLRNEACESR